jgi:hypothetical protein
VDSVALAATIGGAFVGVAGIASNVALARIRSKQDLQLAERQQVHERELARGQRLYERRAPVYESMMKVVQPLMEHVEARSPMMTVGPQVQLPPEPSIDEQRALQVQPRTHGSVAIGDAFQDFFRKVREFLWRASTYETLREQRAPFGDAGVEMETARAQARDAADTLARLVADELSSL